MGQPQRSQIDLKGGLAKFNEGGHIRLSNSSYTLLFRTPAPEEKIPLEIISFPLFQ